MEFTLDVNEWALNQFGDCALGDRRRTKRAVLYAAQVAGNPSGSTPEQTAGWNDCKAAYRLFAEPDVTFEALATPHWRRTRARTAGHYLVIDDTTEFDFGHHRQLSGVGPTGSGSGQGFLLHSALMVEAERESIIGLAGQELFLRQPRPRQESRYDRTQRRRESEVWGRVIDQVGAPAEAVTLTHVLDRGADNFEVFCHLVQNDCHWVVRAAQLKRRIETPQGTTCQLREYLAALPVSGAYELKLRGTAQSPARTARLEVRYGKLTLPAPQHRSPWLRKCGITSISMSVVEAREVNPPKGVKPLHWVLYTSHEVTSFDDAWRVIGSYEKRWLIEEFHKALKTGCRVEQRQYETGKRLAAVAGLLSVVAVRLLQLKAVARVEPNRAAHTVIPRHWIRALAVLRKRSLTNCTVGEFYRQLAALGGFLGRKSDGEPGWQTLWRGFDKLVIAAQVLDTNKNCG